MNCENCNKEHDGTYGSGRFCSEKCAKGFSTKLNRLLINKKVSKTLSNGNNIPWNKGKTNVYSEEVKKKISSSLKKYCKLHPDFASNRNAGRICSIETKKKISDSMRGKSGGFRQRGGRGKQGWYKGIYCNSSWELAFVIYNIDNNKDIQRNFEGFEYIFNDQIHKFYPDFLVENVYFEIKGYMDEKNKAKINSFNKPLELIDKKKIKSYLVYVTQKYGKDFIKLYD